MQDILASGCKIWNTSIFHSMPHSPKSTSFLSGLRSKFDLILSIFILPLIFTDSVCTGRYLQPQILDHIHPRCNPIDFKGLIQSLKFTHYAVYLHTFTGYTASTHTSLFIFIVKIWLDNKKQVFHASIQ